MNSTAICYDNIAKCYNLADRFGSISKSHEIAIQQILKHHIQLDKDIIRILDLGVGDGKFLQNLRTHFPNAEMYGFDVSKEMLKIAQENLDFHAIHASAANADRCLPLHLQDLVLAHFINAYVPMDKLFQQAQWMTKANGYFSFITSTYESFPQSQAQLANYVASDSILGNLVGHYYKSVVAKTTVASGREEIIQQMQHFGFHIVEEQRIVIPIEFKNINDMAEFGIDGTWFLNSIANSPIPKQFFIERLKRFFNKIFTFPYQDEHIIDILLVKK
jgi:ubiquinone/menaquinone biosynthesis C-methylase UbiE